MTHYEIFMKNGTFVSLDADKFHCESGGWTVFYARPAPKEPFEEVKRYESCNIKNIKET